MKTPQCSSKSPHKLKQVWIRKNKSKCHVVFTTLRTRASSEWYFDSGCSKHMTSDKSLFNSLEDFNGGNVTFGNDSVSRVRGRGSISIPSCPKLEGILYVDGLKANLLSINQICANDFRVNFF